MIYYFPSQDCYTQQTVLVIVLFVLFITSQHSTRGPLELDFYLSQQLPFLNSCNLYLIVPAVKVCSHICISCHFCACIHLSVKCKST